MLSLEKKQNKTLSKHTAILVKWFLKFFNRALIEITQFVTFSVTFESYLKCFFSSIEKYHCRLLFWYGIREIHGTRNKRLRL